MNYKEIPKGSKLFQFTDLSIEAKEKPLNCETFKGFLRISNITNK